MDRPGVDIRKRGWAGTNRVDKNILVFMDEVTTHYSSQSSSLKGVLSLNCDCEDTEMLSQPPSRQDCTADYPSKERITGWNDCGRSVAQPKG